MRCERGASSPFQVMDDGFPPVDESAMTHPNAQTQMVFDTNCVLCSGAVHFILRHERDHDIHFVNAWSDTGIALAASYGLSRDDLNETFLVIENGIGLTKSDAVLALARHLRSPWSWGVAGRLIP